MKIFEAEFPPEVESGRTNLETLFVNSPILQVIDGMLEDARTSPLAQRFSKERLAWANLGGMVPAGFGISNLTEEQSKRAQLISDLTHMRNGFLRMLGRLETVYLDLEASKREWK